MITLMYSSIYLNCEISGIPRFIQFVSSDHRPELENLEGYGVQNKVTDVIFSHKWDCNSSYLVCIQFSFSSDYMVWTELSSGFFNFAHNNHFKETKCLILIQQTHPPTSLFKGYCAIFSEQKTDQYPKNRMQYHAQHNNYIFSLFIFCVLSPFFSTTILSGRYSVNVKTFTKMGHPWRKFPNIVSVKQQNYDDLLISTFMWKNASILFVGWYSSLTVQPAWKKQVRGLQCTIGTAIENNVSVIPGSSLSTISQAAVDCTRLRLHCPPFNLSPQASYRWFQSHADPSAGQSFSFHHQMYFI